MYENELYHHGIKGQKWGVRRFQNGDGSLKPAGEKRYGVGERVADYASRSRKTKQTEAMRGVDMIDARNRAIQEAKGKGLRAQLSARYGHARDQAMYEASSKNYQKQADIWKDSKNAMIGKHNRQKYEKEAFNTMSKSNYHKTIRNMSYGKRAVNAALGDPVKAHMPYKSLFSNKTITYGQRRVQADLVSMGIFTAGMLAVGAAERANLR